jgi:hypothetical protein
MEPNEIALVYDKEHQRAVVNTVMNGLRNRRNISWLAEELLAFQSMKFVQIIMQICLRVSLFEYFYVKSNPPILEVILYMDVSTNS